MLVIFTVFLGILLAQASPGPNMMAVAAASLGSGRRSGAATAAGVAAGVFVWAILFASGVGAFLEAFPDTLIAMRFLGGGYLLYLGLRALRSAWLGGAQGAQIEWQSVGATAAWLRGLLVVLTNPKAALMWVAVSMYLASHGLSPLEFLLVGAGASASAMAIYGGYAVLFSSGVAIRIYRRFFRWIEAAFGAVFGALGAKLISDGIRELRN